MEQQSQSATNNNSPEMKRKSNRDFTELGVYREVYPLVIESLKIFGAVCGGVTHSAPRPQVPEATPQQQRKLEFVPEGPRRLLAGKENNHHSISHQLLLESARTSVDILTNLAEGYNAFHSRDKADCYRRARSCLCRSQCFLQVLGSLGAIDNEAATKISSGYSSLTCSFSGLIRSMEQGIDNNNKNGRRAAQQCFRI